MEISEKSVILITGATSGIGRALALRLAKRGGRIALIGRRESLLKEAADEARRLGGEALPIPCDITVREEFERAVQTTIDHFGDLHVLVNNAGRGHCSYVEDTPTEQIESIFAVNVFSLWYGTAAALRHMKPRGRGHIINISSMAGKIGYPGNAAYVAAKHAVVGFTRALRAELAATGVYVTAVIPGPVATDWAGATEGGPMHEIFQYEARRGMEIAQESGRTLPPALPLLTPEQVADVIAATISTPVPEVYTHPGSRELVRDYENDQIGTEVRLEPLWLANLEGYEKVKGIAAEGEDQ